MPAPQVLTRKISQGVEPAKQRMASSRRGQVHNPSDVDGSFISAEMKPKLRTCSYKIIRTIKGLCDKERLVGGARYSLVIVLGRRLLTSGLYWRAEAIDYFGDLVGFAAPGATGKAGRETKPPNDVKAM